MCPERVVAYVGQPGAFQVALEYPVQVVGINRPSLPVAKDIGALRITPGGQREESLDDRRGEVVDDRRRGLYRFGLHSEVRVRPRAPLWHDGK